MCRAVAHGVVACSCAYRDGMHIHLLVPIRRTLWGNAWMDVTRLARRIGLLVCGRSASVAQDVDPLPWVEGYPSHIIGSRPSNHLRIRTTHTNQAIDTLRTWPPFSIMALQLGDHRDHRQSPAAPLRPMSWLPHHVLANLLGVVTGHRELC